VRATGFEKVRLPLLSRAGDTPEIEALAERRLADEYDAAQERSDVSVKGQHGAHVPDKNVRATAADIVLARKETHEARAILERPRFLASFRSPVNAVIGDRQGTDEALVTANSRPSQHSQNLNSRWQEGVRATSLNTADRTVPSRSQVRYRRRFDGSAPALV
jgi:hypothetical protein